MPNAIGTFIHQGETYEANNQNISAVIDSDLLNRMRVYPNPTNNRIYILGVYGNVSIYNLVGQEVLSIISDGIFSVDISLWDNGVYFVKSNQQVVKIIKQ